MTKNKLNQLGFGIIEWLVILIVLIAIGASGYLIYRHGHKTTSLTGTTSSPFDILVLSGSLPGGDFFVTPSTTKRGHKKSSTTTTPMKAEIVTPSGHVVWSRTASSGDEFSNLRMQQYDGQSVLTFAEHGAANGTLGASGNDTGADYILSKDYEQIAVIKPSDGLTFDPHEFWISPQNTAWITADETKTVDLSSMGLSASEKVTESVVEEIDIKTGKLLFRWDSENHAPYSDSLKPAPAKANTAWDWFHVNGVSQGPNGSVLISSRNTSAVYDVNPKTGQVNWVLGGKNSTYKQVAAAGQTLDSYGYAFAWQHDPQYIGNNRFWVFDDEGGVSMTRGRSTSKSTVDNTVPGFSRAVEVQINPTTRTATLIASRNQPEKQTASATGSVQLLSGGDLVVDWGNTGYFSVYNSSGTLLYNAQFPSGFFSYRVYMFNWP